MRNATLAAAIAMALPLPAAIAQETPAATASLGEIIVTAQRRSENIQDVPLSVAALEGERLSAMFEGGGDIQVLAARVPSLYAESSNGRLAPRFYIRGLGNSDFDLAASQPVSIIVDEVVLENVILKSFPMFDLERVEVLRGPQGTLFGRNTPAGIVKFDTKKPTQEFSGDAAVSYGELGSMSFEGAVGGGLTDAISFRLSALYQEREDWIDNDFTGENDAMGGYDEFAYRAQLLVAAFRLVQRAAEHPRPRHRRHGIDLPRQRPRARQRRLQLQLRPRQRHLRRRQRQSAKRQGRGRVAQARLRLWRRRDADVDHRIREYREQQPRRHRRWIRRRLPARRRAVPAGQRPWRSVHSVPVRDPGRHRQPGPAHAGVPPVLAGERPAVLAGGRLLLRLRVLGHDQPVLHAGPHHGGPREHGLGRVRSRQLRRHRRVDRHRWRALHRRRQGPVRRRPGRRPDRPRVGRRRPDQLGPVGTVRGERGSSTSMAAWRTASGRRPSRAATSRSSGRRRSRTRKRSRRSSSASSPSSRTTGSA